MNILDVFYLVGIIFMLLFFTMFIGVIVSFFVIKNKINEMRKNLRKKYSAIKSIRITRHTLAEDTGMLLADLAK